VVDGPYDVSLVEGSVTTPHDAERIQEVRRVSRHLVSIGACATAGGIQSLRNFTAVDEMASVVYAHPEYLSTLESSTPISAHVPVDYELRGCPVDRGQLLEVLTALLRKRKPDIRASSVCLQCKRRGNVCVMVAHGTACLGPVTQAGCGAICPSFERGCYGCFGPMETPNTVSLSSALHAGGLDEAHVMRLFRTFNATAPAFETASRAEEKGDGRL
jgi:coenzyme F420-reducing hydrogenase gamma subunit